MMNSQHDRYDRIELRPILVEWWKAKLWFVLSVVVCIAIAFVYCKVRTEKYAVHASLLIEDDDKSSMGDISITDIFGAKGNVNDERFIISSHALLREVVERLGLERSRSVARDWTGMKMAYSDYPVDIVLPPGMADTLRQSFTFKINVNEKGGVKIKTLLNGDKVASVSADSLPVTVTTQCGDFIVKPTPLYQKGLKVSEKISVDGYDAAAEALMEDIAIDLASKKSNVIRISMPTPDIDYARDIINTLVERYNVKSINRRNEEGNRTIAFIDSRLQLLSGDLAETEAEAETFKKSRNIADIAGEAEYQTLKKGKTEQNLIESETEAEILKMARDFLSSPANAYQLLPASIDNKPLQEAIDQYNKLILKRIALSKNALPGNRQLERLSAQIDAMRDNIITSVSRAYDSRMVAVNQLKSELGSAQARLGDIPAHERGFRDISRRQAVKEKLYLFLLQNREQTAMMLANAAPKGVVIDEAYALNEPLTMKKRYVYLIALVIGLMLPPVVIAVKNILKDKFTTLDELRSLTSLPVLGEVSHSRSKTPLVIYKGADSTVAELFRLIRSHLEFILPAKKSNTLLVTSTSSGEGKTFVSINLAATLALTGKKVIVVGADIRKPRLGLYLSITGNYPGLTSFLSNPDIDVDNIIVRNDSKLPFDVILSGPIPPNPAELLLSQRLDSLFGELSAIYDYVIIDSAPIGMVSDTFTLDRLVQATIYVCRAGSTTFDDIRFVNRLAAENRLKNPAVILNGTKSKKGYGYGYSDNNDV